MSRSFLRDVEPQPTIAPLPRGRFRLFDADTILHQPAPQWLIENLIGQRNFVVLYGASGSHKTFAALHIALCVASGIDCFGNKVRRGPVVYIAAEGEEGFQQRVKAWVHAHPDAPDLVSAAGSAIFMPDAVNLMKEDEVDAWVEQMSAIRPWPSLVVIDTLARCMVGGDENSSRDLGLAIDAAERLRKEIGCTILVIHHTGKKGNLERGSTALRGAADTMLHLRRTSEGLKLVCTKQKNSARFKDLILSVDEIELGEIDSSCVIVHAPSTDLTPSQQKVVRALASGGRTFVDMVDSVLPKTSLRRALRELHAMGFLKKPAIERGGKYQLKGHGLRLGEDAVRVAKSKAARN